jgi:REP element-mobilizing transposase RayT
MKYNPQTHHRRSIRLKGYDYSQAGAYFITICTHNRECLFGTIENGEMMLNDGGNIAEECWLEIPKHFPNVVLHEYIVMPNHVHGIIELVGAKNISPDNTNQHSPGDTGAHQHSPGNTGAHQHSPGNAGAHQHSPGDTGAHQHSPGNAGAHQHSPGDTGAKDFSPLRIPFVSPSRTIGSIIRGYKIGVTKWFRANTDIETVWQRNYHEHIIRNEQSYQTISDYIINNPRRWNDDKFFM